MAKKQSSTSAGTSAPTAESSHTISATTPALNKELLHSMLLQRRFEEKCGEAYALGKIGGFCHLYIGQEAISAGVMSVLRPDDYVVTAYRDHGLALARGMSARSIMAELFGRATGCSGGKGGSMHLFDASTNFLGGHGIVGGHIPLGAGVGFAIKYRGGDQVCVCFFGEAAVNIGSFHESLNMASLWGLPVVFIIENNGYGMGTAIERAMAQRDVKKHGDSYAMDSESIYGQDVFAVREGITRAVERARKDKRPTLLEIRTTRYMGHSMSDAASGTYRKKEELDEAMKHDPVFILRNAMYDAKELTEAEYAKMEEEIQAIVQDSWDFADASPEPSPEELYTHVLVDTTSDTTSPDAHKNGDQASGTLEAVNA